MRNGPTHEPWENRQLSDESPFFFGAEPINKAKLT